MLTIIKKNDFAKNFYILHVINYAEILKFSDSQIIYWYLRENLQKFLCSARLYFPANSLFHKLYWIIIKNDFAKNFYILHVINYAEILKFSDSQIIYWYLRENLQKFLCSARLYFPASSLFNRLCWHCKSDFAKNFYTLHVLYFPANFLIHKLHWILIRENLRKILWPVYYKICENLFYCEFSFS